MPVSADYLKVLAGAVCGITLYGMETTARAASALWLSPADGLWTDATKWSTNPLFPNNGNGGVNYDATINTTGANYTVTLNTNITVDSLLLNSANATVSHTSGIFKSLGTTTLTQGTYTLAGGTIQSGIWNVSNGASLSVGGGGQPPQPGSTERRLDGVTVNGDLSLSADNAFVQIAGGTTFSTAHLRGASSWLAFAPGQTLTGTVLFEGNAAFGRYVGTNGGPGSITVGATGVIRTGADFSAGTGTVGSTPYGNDGATGLTNQGLISSETAGQTIRISPSALTSSGTLRALNGGTLDIASTTTLTNYNLATTTLTGGTWNVVSSGTATTLDLNREGNISVNNASILLSGVNSVFTEINALNNNQGTFALANGRDFTTAGALANSGAITVTDAATDLTVTGDFSNSGSIAAEAGRVFVTGGAFTNSGEVLVFGNGALFDVTADTNVTNYNLATTTLTGGAWRVVSGAGGPATLGLNRGGNITTNNASVLLSGVDSVFTEINALSSNQGTFALAGGRDFTTAGALANSGGIVLTGAATDLTVTGAFTNTATGTVTLQGGRLAGANLTNTGVLSGFGAVAGRPVNSGTIRSSGGTLAFNSGIQGGSGTVQIDPGSVLDLSAGASGSSADFLIHNGNTAGSLNLGANSFTVGVDYTNANAGTGNAYNPRANIAGTGQILAAGSTAQALTGDVTGGATATAALAFGNLHVGDTATLNYQIANTGTTGPALLGAVQTAGGGGGSITDARLSGAGVTAGNFGPLVAGANSGSLAVTFTAGSAGALTGQTVGIVNNFGNVTDQTLAITGAAFRYAVPVHAPEPVAFGNVHVGDAVSQALTVSNTAASDGFSESLNAGIGGATGGVTTNGGTFSALAAGTVNSGSLTVGINTATAGIKNGTAALSLVSDGAGTSGLGQTALTAQTVSVTGTVYRLAEAGISGGTAINFGIVHVGDTVSQSVSLTNTAVADGFSEHLNAGFSGSTGGITAGGSLGPLAPGSSGTSLVVGVDTSVASAIAGTATISLESDGAASSGLGQTGLSAETLSITAQVNNFASPVFVFASGAGTLTQESATAFTLDFGTVNNSGIDPAPFASVSLLNDVNGPADTLAGNFTAAGDAEFTPDGFDVFTGIAAGEMRANMQLLLDNSVNGFYSGTVTLSALSQNAGGYSGGLGNYVLNVTATVVPEPSHAVLLLLTGAGLLLRRVRGRRA